MKIQPVLAVLVFIAIVAASNTGRSADGSDMLLAQQVVHLLDYVGSDYGGAVSNGSITNDKELAEQIEVLAEASRVAAKLRAPPNGESPQESIEQIKRLVESLRPEAEVIAAVKAARSQLAAVFDLVEAPREPPLRVRGEQLYQQHCAACHGADGRADTPRASQLSPKPANFIAPEVAGALSPLRVFAAARFGVPNTAMVPFDFLSEAERWDIGFYVSELDHAVPATTKHDGRIFGLGELAAESDDELRDDLRSAGFAESDIEPALADLRLRAPYDAETLRPAGPAGRVLRARAGLKKLTQQLLRGDREGARARILAVYLDDVEPIEAPLRATDPALCRDIETRFKEIRVDIDRGLAEAALRDKVTGLLALMGRAGRALEGRGRGPSFTTIAAESAGIGVREGAEAALLIAALLAVVGRAGRPERKRWVHAGWIAALVAGALTWLAARRMIEMSGMSRELLEGGAALLASAILFYVSYWLFAKREAARWLSYLRAKAGGREAALSLFGISFLAVYREAFETVIFYQALIAQPGTSLAAGVGALVGAAFLVALVVAYGRAGKFAPPRSFFMFSSLLLYGLAVVFAGQGISALQTTGHLPLHPVRMPNLPALGIYPTLETYAVQTILVALALGAAVAVRLHRAPPAPPPVRS